MVHFTQGVWKTEEDADGSTWVRIPGHDIYICNIEGSCSECYGNAFLIENTPDLYKALKDLLQVVNVRIDDPRIKQFDFARAVVERIDGGI